MGLVEAGEGDDADAGGEAGDVEDRGGQAEGAGLELALADRPTLHKGQCVAGGAEVERVAGADAVGDVEHGGAGLDDGDGDRVGGVGDGEVGGGADPVGEAAQGGQGGVGEQRLGAAGQVEQADADAQAAGGVAAHERVFDQGGGETVDHGAADAEARCGLGHSDPARGVGDQGKQANATVEGLRSVHRNRVLFSDDRDGGLRRRRNPGRHRWPRSRPRSPWWRAELATSELTVEEFRPTPAIAGRRWPEKPAREIRTAATLRTLERFGLAHELDRMVELFFEVRFANSRPFAGVVETLEKLRPEYQLGYATNANSEAHLCGLKGQFAFEIYALRDTGIPKKPAVEFYAAVAEAAGNRPEEIVYVGDTYEHDIVGPAAYGMRTVWLNKEGLPVPGQTATGRGHR